MKIKLIILDLDGTLYDLHDVHSANYDLQVQFLSQEKQIDKNDAIKLLTDNCVFPTISNDSKSATELFARIGLDMQKWKQYREQHFDPTKICLSKAVKQETIIELSKIAPIVLLSSNSYNNIKKILQYLSIDHNLFAAIYCSDNMPTNNPFTKKEAIKYISQKNKIPYAKMLSIGDRFQTDIAPMIELGGYGIVVKCPWNMTMINSKNYVKIQD